MYSKTPIEATSKLSAKMSTIVNYEETRDSVDDNEPPLAEDTAAAVASIAVAMTQPQPVPT